MIGVYYRTEDYIGLGRRLAIDLIDSFVAVAVCVPISTVFFTLWPDDESLSALIFVVWIVVWFCYFVLLKRSRFRTLGYVLYGARIVNLQGERPGSFSLTGRLLFVAGGPANVVIDLLWISSDPCRQAVRDKFARTYVVRRDAVPAGTGRIVYRTYVMFGTTFLFQEVQVAETRAT